MTPARDLDGFWKSQTRVLKLELLHNDVCEVMIPLGDPIAPWTVPGTKAQINLESIRELLECAVVELLASVTPDANQCDSKITYPVIIHRLENCFGFLIWYVNSSD